MTSSNTGASSNPGSPTAQNVETLILQHMAIVNKLCLKAFNATSKEPLSFIILNDTVQAIRYDRAILWDYTEKNPKLVGVSGQTTLNKDAKLIKQWEELRALLIDPKISQKLQKNSFSDDGKAFIQYQLEARSNIVTVPIFAGDELVLSLWLEGFGERFQADGVEDSLNFLQQYLTPAYGSAWNRFYKKSFFSKIKLNRQQTALILIAASAFLLLTRVPLRVVAPCEVVANEPFIVTAPLEGIIENVDVKPGQVVKSQEILYEYDKRLPLRNLSAAEKQVQILKEEVKRARTLGLNDPKSLTELNLLNLKLQKGEVDLSYVQWQETQLTQRAYIGGVIMMENPDEWRGKPVKIGEKIMSINDPANTKIKIRIPEDDNIILDPENPIKIVLNINPGKTYLAHLDFVANESTVSDLQIPSFLAEAQWQTPPEDNKLGLKGTAVLYGQKVSLFYYLIRKPLSAARRHLGL